MCVHVCVCAVSLHTLPFKLSSSTLVIWLEWHILPCVPSKAWPPVSSPFYYVIKTHQRQYSFCQMLQDADRAGTCRRTSSCHDSQTGNRANSRHCWTDMRPVNLYTIHEPCEQCRLLKVSLCSGHTKANKLLCLVSHSSAEAWCLPSPHFHITILIPYFDLLWLSPTKLEEITQLASWFPPLSYY